MTANGRRVSSRFLAALVAATAFVSTAAAQGLYYRETEKDGKVFVFNLARELEAFQKGTPPAKAIERMGWGPKGETVVFDSPEALNLYAFKHGKAPEAPPAPEPPKKDEPKKDEPKPLKVSGYVFGDVYYFAQDHDAKFDGQGGLWFRRGYLTVDRDLGSAWSARLRLEVNSPSLQETQDRLRPYVKDAYLRWTRGRHQVFVGMSQSPTWGLVEEFWGYRHVEKTPLDLKKWGDSRDTGVGVKGSFDKDKKYGYHAMVGTGTGTRSETDKDKKLHLAVSARPVKGWVFEVYGDFENRKDEKDVSTLQGFAGYETKSFRGGLLYAHQTRQQGTGRADLELDLLSAFATGKIGERAWWVARADQGFDPEPAGASISYLPFAPTAKSTFLLAGLDLLPNPSVRVTPNVEVITYGGATPRPRTDVVARITLYWTF